MGSHAEQVYVKHDSQRSTNKRSRRKQRNVGHKEMKEELDEVKQEPDSDDESRPLIEFAMVKVEPLDYVYPGSDEELAPPGDEEESQSSLPLYPEQEMLTCEQSMPEPGFSMTKPKKAAKSGEKKQRKPYTKKMLPGSYECQECDRVCPTKRALITHSRWHKKPRKIHACLVCEKIFPWPAALRTHMRSHTGERPFKCSLCPKSFTVSSNLAIHQRQHTGVKPFICGECGKEFRMKCTLQNHTKSVHKGEKPYACDQCGKRFTRDHHLMGHYRIHTGERPYECEHCGKKFTDRGTLNRHLRIHTGETPYHCTMCDAKFGDSVRLKLHNRKHTGERPYKCTICPMEYAHHSNLKRHKESHMRAQRIKEEGGESKEKKPKRKRQCKKKSDAIERPGGAVEPQLALSTVQLEGLRAKFLASALAHVPNNLAHLSHNFAPLPNNLGHVSSNRELAGDAVSRLVSHEVQTSNDSYV